MKAAVYHTYGSPEVVGLAEIPAPAYGAGEMLIKIRASTVNRTDCGFRSAEYFISRFFSGLLKPKYPVLGCEFSGEVIAVHSSVTRFKSGDRVFGFNDKKFGGHAEFTTAKETDPIAIIPENISFEEATCLTEGAHYALCDLRAAGILKGMQVLIHGATGSIGSAAVQLCKYFGAHVTAVCFDEHIHLISQLGADVVLGKPSQNFLELPVKFDIIFDAVGKSSFGECKPLLQPNGIYMSTELGKNGENIWRSVLTRFGNGKRLLFPLPTINQKDVEFLADLARDGQFKPMIDRYFTLDDIVEAHKYVETGKKLGNVVIKIAE